MERDEIIQKFASINVWKKGDERAPHKPLLILYALGKCSRGEDRFIPFSQIDTAAYSDEIGHRYRLMSAG